MEKKVALLCDSSADISEEEARELESPFCGCRSSWTVRISGRCQHFDEDIPRLCVYRKRSR
ncbi:MAG: hypothetical protein ACLVJ6_15160 [Merdibacter sp.]